MKGENIMNITNQEMMTDLYNITLENAFGIFEKSIYEYKELLENSDDDKITRNDMLNQVEEWTKTLESIHELKRYIQDQRNDEYV